MNWAAVRSKKAAVSSSVSGGRTTMVSARGFVIRVSAAAAAFPYKRSSLFISSLPAEAGEGDAFDEGALGDDEDESDRDEDDGGGGHQAGPVDDVQAEEIEQSDLQRVLLRGGEIDQGIEEVGPAIDEGEERHHH